MGFGWWDGPAVPLGGLSLGLGGGRCGFFSAGAVGGVCWAEVMASIIEAVLREELDSSWPARWSTRFCTCDWMTSMTGLVFNAGADWRRMLRLAERLCLDARSLSMRGVLTCASNWDIWYTVSLVAG